MSGRVYIIIAQANPVCCKIGFTRGNPRDRMRNLQCGSVAPLNLFCDFPGSQQAERVWHDTFAPLRVHGEWFEIKAKLRDFLFYLLDDVENGRAVSGETLCIAVCDVILADEPFHPEQDKDEYLASADTRHFDGLRDAMEADRLAGAW
jgi:hypothetical protein